MQFTALKDGKNTRVVAAGLDGATLRSIVVPGAFGIPGITPDGLAGRPVPRRQRLRAPAGRPRSYVALRDRLARADLSVAETDRPEGDVRLRRALAGRLEALPDPAHDRARLSALHRPRLRPAQRPPAPRPRRRQGAEELGHAGLGGRARDDGRRPLGVHALHEPGRLPVRARARHGARRRPLRRPAVDGGEPGRRLAVHARRAGEPAPRPLARRSHAGGTSTGGPGASPAP